ncbi:AMP-binding protein [Vibrio metschnikovii]|uniref:AMP-binding protein n=1 Tax=Vibrio metschnikovii TaxID=28172 RepID=UPI001C30CE91|nr:AMP-binding protein [Vibrio metschnikovii]
MSNDAIYDQAPWVKLYSPEQLALHQGHAKDSHAWRSIPEMLSEAAAKYSQRKAFTTCMPNGMNGSLTFGQVDEMSTAFAHYLRGELGLQAGDRVAVQMPNCLSLPVAVIGVLKSGCILTSVNPLYSRREMKHQFSDAGVKAIVICDMFTDKLQDVIEHTPIQHVIVTSLAQWFPPVVRGILKLVLKYWNKVIPPHQLTHHSIDQAIHLGRLRQKNDKLNVEEYWQGLTRADTALLQYTGGTTGVAKGAMLSHGNLLGNVEQMDSLVQGHVMSGQETVLTALPLYHIFAFSVNLLEFWHQGAHNILVPSPRPIQNCQRAFDNYPISWMTGVNTLYNALLNEEWFTTFPPKHLKAALAGGTALHATVAERWQKAIHCPLVEGYGLTESSPVLCFNPLTDPRPDCIGIPTPGTQLRLVDDDGHTVPLGEPGELIAKGVQIMQGYWQQPEETAHALREGWLYTGDIAIMHPDGRLRLVDRKKDLILVSGFNVYPNEVEEAIAGLEQVMESAVVGVPEPLTGEQVQAYVVLREQGLDEASVKKHCKKELAAYKVPKKVVFVDELPKTPVGKVLRKDVRAMALGQSTHSDH